MNPTVTIELSEYNRLLEIEEKQNLIKIERSDDLIWFTVKRVEFLDENALIQEMLHHNYTLRKRIIELKKRNLWQRIWNIT